MCVCKIVSQAAQTATQTAARPSETERSELVCSRHALLTVEPVGLKCSSYAGDAHAAKEQLQATQDSLDQTQQQLGATVRQLQDTTNELHSTRSQLHTTTNELEGTVKRLDSTQSELHTTQDRLEGTVNELDRSQKLLRGTSQELTSTKSKLADIKYASLPQSFCITFLCKESRMSMMLLS